MVFYNNDYKLPKITPQPDLDKIIAAFREKSSDHLAEKAVKGIIALLEEEIKQVEAELHQEEEELFFDGIVHAFSAHRIPRVAHSILRQGELQELQKALISKVTVFHSMVRAERLLGSSKEKSTHIVEEFLNYMEAQTVYPCDEPASKSLNETKTIIKNLIEKISQGVVEGRE